MVATDAREKPYIPAYINKRPVSGNIKMYSFTSYAFPAVPGRFYLLVPPSSRMTSPRSMVMTRLFISATIS